MSIANNLRQLRLNVGMTQDQVAEKIGVTRQALSSYESGRTCPDIDMLVRLSEVYGTDIAGVVYGQNHALKSLRIVKKLSLFLYVAIVVMTAISSLFLWCANRYFTMPTGQLSPEEKIRFESHARLTNAWETLDAVILIVAIVGFVLLVILFATWKCRVSMKVKAIYILTIIVIIFLVAALFGVTDPVHAPVNYLIAPIRIIVCILILFLVHLVIEYLQKRRGNRPPK